MIHHIPNEERFNNLTRIEKDIFLDMAVRFLEKDNLFSIPEDRIYDSEEDIFKKEIDRDDIKYANENDHLIYLTAVELFNAHIELLSDPEVKKIIRRLKLKEAIK